MSFGSAVVFLLAGAQAGTGPVVYPDPPGLKHNDDFTVRVRAPGGAWRDLFEHSVTVDLDAPQQASMVRFDMAGPVEVEVRRNNGDVRSVVVRPDRAGIRSTLDGRTARFTISKPAKVSVEFDGDRLHNVHVFARAVDRDIPDRADAKVIWFDPGIHVPPDRPGSVFSFPSDRTIYLAPGAVLRGKIVLDRVSNVTIRGRGLIDEPERGVEVTYARNVAIDGVTVVNPKHYTVFCGQSQGVRISDMTTFSAKPWSDGLDFMSCSDVTVSDVFLRTSDDAIAIYGHRWGFAGDARNFVVQDAVLWADVAHPINIGLHGGGKDAPETIERLAFRRIDILEQDEDDRDYQGALAISNGDDNLVRDVLFDDVRIDELQEGSLFNFRVVYNAKYSLSPGRGIVDVRLRNIRAAGGVLNPSIIAGFDATRAIRGVSIEGLTIGGRRIADAIGGDIRIEPFAEDVTIRK
ncbi:glycosyl hydrolase family 28 protein [Sphingomonas sp. RS2018]